MFAVVRTGGKQYRVSAGDKIAVEKLAGEAGDTIELGDVLLAGDGGDMKDAAKVKVAAEIIAQAKGEKVTVFKKRRRHNYRRKAGHRQQLTLLRIVQVGDTKAEKKATKAAPKKEEAKQADAAPVKVSKTAAVKDEPAKGVDTKKETKAQKAEPVKKAATAAKADEKKPAAKKAPAKKAPAKKAAAPKKETAAAKKPAAKKAPAKKPAAKK